MQQPATSARSFANPHADALYDHLPEVARRQLEALRSALEVRLARLEDVLADPTRGESLETLILDLARVATEEAQATAALACIDVKRSADAEHDRLRTAATELRQLLDQAQQRGTALEREKESERAKADGALRETESQLAALKRSSAADAQQAAARAAELASALDAAHARAEAIEKDLSARLARAQQIGEHSARALAEARQQLDLERTAGAELQYQLDQANVSAGRLQDEYLEILSARDGLGAQVAGLQERIASTDGALREARTALDAERSAAEELRRTVNRAEEQTAAATHEQALVESSVHQLEAEAARLRDAVADERRRRADVEAALVDDRAAGDELRSVMKRAKVVLVALEQHNAAMHARYRDALSELEHSRESAAEHERARAETESLLQTERALNTELRDLVERSTPRAPAGSDVAPPVTDQPSSPEPAAALSPPDDESAWQPVRLADRFAFPEPIEILINGEPGLLCDLSTAGCQLVSPNRLKPNHAIRIGAAGPPPLLCPGKVMWVNLELPTGGRPLGYRAGVQFTSPDLAAIEAFIAMHAAR